MIISHGFIFSIDKINNTFNKSITDDTIYRHYVV